MTDTRINQQPANKEIEESLSALVDGQASEMEIRRVLKACENNPALRRRWHRHQLVKQVLKNDDVDLSIDLSASISAAIADEPSINTNDDRQCPQRSASAEALASLAESKSDKIPWANVGRFAIAASVAAVVILGVQYAPVDQSPIASAPEEPLAPLSEQIVYEGLASKNIVETVSHSPNTRNPSVRTNKQPITISSNDLREDSNDMQALQRQLNRLMLEHVENASQNNYQGILPYVRVPSGE